MVVRRTDNGETGLTAAAWLEDRTTTTYQPSHLRPAATARRRDVGPAPQMFAPAMAGAAGGRASLPPMTNMYAHAPSPRLTLPVQALDVDDNPFARPRSAIGASFWNALAFAGLFASVLIGRVIVQAGQEGARASAPRAAATQPAAQAPKGPSPENSGAGGVGVNALAPHAAREQQAQPTAASDAPAQPAETPTAQQAQPEPELSQQAQPTAATPGEARTQHAAERGSVAETTAATTPAASAQGANALDREKPQPAATSASAPRTPHAAERESQAQPAAANPYAARAQGASALDREKAQPAATSASAARTRAAGERSDEALSAAGGAARGKYGDAAAHAPRGRSARVRAEALDWRRESVAPNEGVAPSPPPAARQPVADATAALGTLRINSRPWSQVFIDGRLVGNTPQLGLRLPAGRYTVRLANPELGMTKTLIVNVPAGELVSRVETLEEP